MSELNINDVREMAYELYKGNSTKFDADSANTAIKNIILETAGCKDNWDMYKFMDNKYKVFAVMKEILTPVVAENVIARFEQWVDIIDVALGDTVVFEVMNQDLFEIGYVADGTSELRRQRLVNGKLAMTSFNLGAKLYTEFDDFRRGRVDFAGWIEKLGRSFEVKIGEIIAMSVAQSYSSLGAFYGVTGAYNEATLITMIERIEAKTGKSAVIYGTKSALANLRSAKTGVWSESEKEEFRRMGYVGNFYGSAVVELPQSLDKKDGFILDNNVLYVIPDGTKIVKLAFEGDVDVVEVADNKTRKDMQFEYMFMRRIQIGVCKASVYGMYKISA